MTRYDCKDCGEVVTIGDSAEDESANVDIAVELHKLNHNMVRLIDAVDSLPLISKPE